MSNYCQNCYELAEENDRLKEEIKRIGEMRKCYKENLKLCKWQEQQINKLATKLEVIDIICNEAPAIDTELSLRILEVIEGAEDE